MYAGMTAAGAAFLISSALLMILHRDERGTYALVLSMLVPIALGFMMFASSFVEEEQHFWYWISAPWFTAMYIARCVAMKCYVN